MFIMLALLCACVSAFAQSGTSCDDAIRLGSDYAAQITGAGPKWYVGNTFDLPMTVKFYPQNNSDPAPSMEFDFTCTPGVYEDSILNSLFNPENSGYVPMPATVVPVEKTDDQNRKYYEVAMGEEKRNLLLWAGISYDVDVYIKVTYYGRGDINVTPDAEFSQCMDTKNWLLFGRELEVEANDDETFFVAPFANWQQDSVRYIWQGNSSATVAMGTTCGFDPLDALDDRRVDVKEMNAGGDTVEYSNADIQHYMQYMQDPGNTAKGGIFYVKVVSDEPGTLKIERKPETPPAGGAILLEYDQPNAIAANNSQLYAISRDWTIGTLFETPTGRVFKMYIGASEAFTTETAMGSCQFNRGDEGHWYGLTENELSSLWNQVPGEQKYLYVRFECTESTTMTPSAWTPSECYEKATLIEKNSTVDVAIKSKQIYRIFYADWKDGALTATWVGQRACKMLISGSCTIGTNVNVESVIDYEEAMASGTAYARSISEMAEWGEYADADGYIYMRFYSDKAGTMTLSTTAPEEEDPACVPYDTTTVVSSYVPYTWRGTTYDESTEISIDGTIDVETGCMDSLFTLRLTILETTYSEQTHEGCDEVTVLDKQYTVDADVNDTTYDAAGNRTITTHHIRVGHSHDITLPDTTVCVGDFVEGYLFVDTLITTTGTYTRHLKTARNCDSILTQTVTILQETYGKDIVTAYDSYTWINGTTYYASTKGPVGYLPNAAGCDSIISLNLTIKHLHLDTVRQTICASELPYEWYGKSCEAAGYHNADTIIAEEVDTVRTLDLTVRQESYSDTTATACDVFTWYGKSYTQSGYPTRRLTNAVGCDSIITLNLTIHYSTSSEEYRSEYQSYTWNGETYRNSGTYIYQTTNVAGCDSTAILHLTLHQDTIVEYFCPKSGIVEHVDTMSAPHISYLSYVYEKPRKEMYMDGVVSGETNEGANVDLARVLSNLDAYYVAPLTPVETIIWRYMPFGGQSEILSPGAGPQWMNAGTISMDVIFRCGYRYYSSFTIGKMTEGTEMMTTDEQPIKRVENGQVVIIRNGKKYSIFGSKIE